jgi:hypothetical protein
MMTGTVEFPAPARRRCATLLIRGAAIAMLAASTSGCLVLNLWPLYGDATIEFDEALTGAWENTEDQQRLRVERAEWRSYTVTWSDGSATRTATGHLTTVGKHRYVDLRPEVGEDRGPLLVPVHAICRVRLDGDNLHVELLDFDWLSAPGRQGALPAGGVTVDERGNLLLTVPSPRLRTWLLHLSETAAAFTPPRVFVRTAPVEPAR